MILRLLIAAIHSLFVPPPPPPEPPEMSDAEIDARLIAKRDAEKPGLDPINSIVDLMKLFGLDSSIEARAELWHQMRLPGEFATGTAEENQTLMKEFRKQIAIGDFGF